MDPIAISALTATAWSMLQPYLKMIANKSAEKIGELAPDAIGKLWGRLLDKFEAKPSAKEAASDLLMTPDDADVQAAFRVQLRKALEEDPAFAKQVKELVEKGEAQINVRVGSGAAAIGDYAKAVGEDGILIEGNVKGDVIGAGGSKDG